MIIFMVMRAAKPYDETIVSNVKPYSTRDKALQRIGELTNSLTAQDELDYVEFYIEEHEVE